jgi:transposase
VPEKATRRKFTAEYKLRILREADACKDKPGEVGKLLRQEGLYSSHLTAWRKQRKSGELRGLAPRKRGRQKKMPAVSAKEVVQLRRENARLKRELEQAKLVIDIQKRPRRCWGSP